METEKVEELKAAVLAKLPDYNINWISESDLKKWLTARDFDVNASVQLFCNHLEFRRRHKLDEGFMENYVYPEVLQKYYPGGICGTCKEGYVVKYEMPGKLDVKGLLMSITDDEFLEHALFKAETLLQKLKDNEAANPDRALDKWTIVIDAEGFSIRQMTKSVMQRQKIIAKIFEDNYPDRLYCSYIVNCSKLFRLLLKMVKLTMDPTTFSKFQILDHKEELLTYIDKSQLPARYGGSIQNDGLCDGGKIPYKYYQFDRLLETTKDWPRKDVKAGSESSVEIEVVEASKYYLAWEFYTVKNRITFSLYHKTSKDAPPTKLISPYKVECELWPESGSHDCLEPGIYMLLFSNLTSKVKSKTVVYSIQLLERE